VVASETGVTSAETRAEHLMTKPNNFFFIFDGCEGNLESNLKKIGNLKSNFVKMVAHYFIGLKLNVRIFCSGSNCCRFGPIQGE